MLGPLATADIMGTRESELDHRARGGGDLVIYVKCTKYQDALWEEGKRPESA